MLVLSRRWYNSNYRNGKDEEEKDAENRMTERKENGLVKFSLEQAERPAPFTFPAKRGRPLRFVQIFFL